MENTQKGKTEEKKGKQYQQINEILSVQNM